MTVIYTRETLSTREMSKPKLQAIAAGLEIEFENSDTKATLIDWILFAQDQAAQDSELDETPPELDAVEAVEPTIEENLIEFSSEPTYEERLVLYLDRRVSEFREDSEAAYLLQNFAEFRDSLTAKATKKRTPRTGAGRPVDPAEKISLAREVHEAVVRFNGSYKLAGDSIGKSAHYVKVIAKAYELYNASELIHDAYDAGQLKWTGLYNLAFGFKKADSVVDVEARMNQLAIASAA